jgi:hypothetical protein
MSELEVVHDFKKFLFRSRISAEQHEFRQNRRTNSGTSHFCLAFLVFSFYELLAITRGIPAYHGMSRTGRPRQTD